ncbi:hypothetical protein OAP56_00285 [Rickettsiaceae bacterium]|nr:hypothetical protein [Rickettsiaceae bacterium]
MTTDNKTNKEHKTAEQEYKLLEWGEPQFIAHVSTIVSAFALDEKHIQKICLDSGDNVYLVPEKFYKDAISAMKVNKQKK